MVVRMKTEVIREPSLLRHKMLENQVMTSNASSANNCFSLKLS